MVTELTCPKCQSPMRSYERNGITVEQCTGCSGLFLDRGELERLISAEDVYYGDRSGAVDSSRRGGGFLDTILGGRGGRRGHH